MTKSELRKNYGKLRKSVNKMLRDYLDAALKSGAISDLKEEESTFRIPKNILCAALRNAAWQYAPIKKSDVKDINNIYACTPSV